MSLDFLHSLDATSNIPLVVSLFDRDQSTVFFNKWKWLPHPETNAKSGIFVRCNTEYDDSIIELPEVIPVNYGKQAVSIPHTAEMRASLERDLIAPHDNFITPSAISDTLFVSMCYGKLCGVYADLNILYVLFTKLRHHYFDRTVNGEVTERNVSFKWNSFEKLTEFLLMFADAFYEWDVSWNRNR